MEKREIYINWIRKTLELEIGEELYIPVDNKQSQKTILRGINKELRIMEVFDLAATQVYVTKTFKDKRLWVLLKKTGVSPFVGFKKGVDGVVQRVSIDSLSEKMRRLTLMIEDGLNLEEVQEIEGELTNEEAKFFRGRGGKEK